MSVPFRDILRFATTYEKARKETLKAWACQRVLFREAMKVAISVCHKALNSSEIIAGYGNGRKFSLEGNGSFVGDG